MIDDEITASVINLIAEISNRGGITNEEIIDIIYKDDSLNPYQKTCVGFLMGFISGKTR
jgi:hypothetical protein